MLEMMLFLRLSVVVRDVPLDICLLAGKEATRRACGKMSRLSIGLGMDTAWAPSAVMRRWTSFMVEVNREGLGGARLYRIGCLGNHVYG